MPVDFLSLPPLVSHQGNEGNRLEIDVNSIPAIIFQMAYNKLYIPLSLLTTASLDRICNNQNLWFHKVPFGNGVGKQTLDDSSFPTEDTLDATTFLQAYCNWLSIVDRLADSILAGGFHSHYDRMIADSCFNTHFLMRHFVHNLWTNLSSLTLKIPPILPCLNVIATLSLCLWFLCFTSFWFTS